MAGRHALLLSPNRKTGDYWSPAIPLEVKVHLRFGKRPDGRVVVTRLEVSVPPEQGAVSSRLLDHIPLARIEAAINGRGGIIHETTPKGSKVMKVRTPRLKLRIPEGRKYPDAFYQRVADAYAFLAVVSRRPMQDLADANDVPVSTVNRWIRQARDRGILPPGQRQKGEER